MTSDYISIFKNPADRTQFMHLPKRLLPTNLPFLTMDYDDATQTQRSYIMIDTKAEIANQFRVRANIFLLRSLK